MGLPGTKQNKRTRLTRGAVLAASVALSLSAVADEHAGYWYAGAGIGYSNNNGKITDITSAPGLCAAFPCAISDSDTGYKLFAGYQFSELLGLEGEFTRLPNTLEVKSADFISVPTATFGVSQDSNIFSLRGVVTKSIVSKFSISAVLGASLWKSELEGKIVQGGVIGPGAADSEEDTGLSINFGARINYDFNDNLRLRGSWDRYNNLGDASAATVLRPGQPLIADTVDTDTDLFSIELVYRFR